MTSRPHDSDVILLPGDSARLWLWPKLLGASATNLMAALLVDLPWQQPSLKLFGRCHPIPRLQCWMGDPDTHYRYSGLDLAPLPWLDGVRTVRDRAEAVTGQRFNSVLINLYRDGADRMGWHSDNEPELGPEPWVASWSMGATRRFSFRRRGETRTAHSLALVHDDLLLMGPEVQHRWQHAVPVMKRVTEPRINMTFRHIRP